MWDASSSAIVEGTMERAHLLMCSNQHGSGFGVIQTAKLRLESSAIIIRWVQWSKVSGLFFRRLRRSETPKHHFSRNWRNNRSAVYDSSKDDINNLRVPKWIGGSNSKVSFDTR